MEGKSFPESTSLVKVEGQARDGVERVTKKEIIVMRANGGLDCRTS